MVAEQFENTNKRKNTAFYGNTNRPSVPSCPFPGGKGGGNKSVLVSSVFLLPMDTRLEFNSL